MPDLGGMLGGVGSTAMGWVSGTMFWAIIIVVVLLVGVGALFLRKRRLLDKWVLEVYDIGDGSKPHFEYRPKGGGWFKNKITLRGLIDFGSERMFRLADMTPVFDVSHNDYFTMNGKLGLIILRNPNDPKFAIPLSKMNFSDKSRIAMAEIAPVDLRNAGTAAIEETNLEMTSKWQQWAPIIVTIAMLLCLVFSIMFISQMEQKSSANSAASIKYGFDTMKELHISYTPDPAALKAAGVNPEDVGVEPTGAP